MQAIEYRGFARGDRKKLLDLLRAVWFPERFTEHKGLARRLLLKTYYEMRAQETLLCVASVGGEMRGVLCARIGRPRMTRRIRYFPARLALSIAIACAGKAGRTAAREYGKMGQAFHEMEADVPVAANELILFAVDAPVRSQGVGRALMQRFEEALRAAGQSAFFLFTDTQCDYTYYDHNGYYLAAQRSVALTLPHVGQANVTTFLYTKDI